MSPISLITLLLFILGLFVGSFLNVVSDRLHKERGFLAGRSSCDHCKRKLGALDLIPVLSFVFLRGRCRYCKTKLSLYYPLSEILTGLLFAASYAFLINYQNVSIPFFIYFILVLSGFIIVFLSDARYGEIYDKVIVYLIVVILIYTLLFNTSLFLVGLVMGASFFLLFFLIALISKGQGMGGGDIKLAFVLGLFLGFPNAIFALYIAFLTGATVGLILVLWGRKKSVKETIPFGPFLILGAIISVYFEPVLLTKFLQFLNP